MTQKLAFSNVPDLLDRLQDLHQRTRETPLFNPVFQLGLEFSRKLESDEMGLADFDALVSALECEGLLARAAGSMPHLLSSALVIGPIEAAKILALPASH